LKNQKYHTVGTAYVLVCSFKYLYVDENDLLLYNNKCMLISTSLYLGINDSMESKTTNIMLLSFGQVNK